MSSDSPPATRLVMPESVWKYGSATAPSNGEVEGPRGSARYAPRAHTVFPRPRRQTDHVSRTPPTIVRHMGIHVSWRCRPAVGARVSEQIQCDSGSDRNRRKEQKCHDARCLPRPSLLSPRSDSSDDVKHGERAQRRCHDGHAEGAVIGPISPDGAVEKQQQFGRTQSIEPSQHKVDPRDVNTAFARSTPLNYCDHMPNGEVEGPPRSARWRQGRTISQRPRRQAASASRPPPTIVRPQPPYVTLSHFFQSDCHSTPSTMRKSRSAAFPSTRSAC